MLAEDSFAPPVASAVRLQRGGWYLVSLLMAVQVVSYVDRFLPSLLVPDIKADLHLSDFQVGLLLGPAFAIFYVAVGLPFGWAADRLSRRGILAFGIAVWCAMTAAASLAWSFLPLFAARLGVGFGEAAVAPCAVSLIGDAFPPARRAKPIALYMAGSFVGAGSAFLFGGPLVHAIQHAPPLIAGMRPWQSVFLVVGAPGLLLALLMLTIREPARAEVTSTATATLGAALGYIRRRWRAFGALFVASACSVTLGALSFWNVALFQRTWGWNVGQVGVATGLMFFTAGPLGAVASVWLSRRGMAQGRSDATLRSLLCGLVIAAPGLALFPLAPSAPIALVGMFIGLFGGSIATTAGPVSVTLLAPGQIRGKATSIYYLVISLVGQFLGPPPVGWMVDRFGHPSALRYAMSIETVAVSVPAILLVALGLPAFRRAAEELERARTDVAHG
ncbi:MFS transporter [Caulobacter sp. S45]|uniref:MFS transporter n=1 Tax=Caulobacter sp. S45 TaxID=1641861 RepID=UPI001576B745|nr:MFS transporter [Caulobacter sp. S45]